MQKVIIKTCNLCGALNPREAYAELWRESTYTGYYCAKCDLFQTLGDIEQISPEYESMQAVDLTEAHIILQTSHKHSAFRQWEELMIQQKRGHLQGRLLDIGCGIGGFLDEAKARGLDVYGYDASAVHVEEARKRHPNVRNCIELEDYVATLPEGRRFDYITMWDVLEHIRNPAPLLQSVKNVLADDGLFFVSVPGGGPIPLKLTFSRVFRSPLSLSPWEHVFYYTPRSLRYLFEQNGFEVADISGVVTYPRELTLKEMLRRVVTSGLRRTRLALQIYGIVRLPK